VKKEGPLSQYWLVVGSPEHWKVAFENGNVWGLQARKKGWWERITEGDGLAFYVNRPVGGAIGLGRVSTKFKQDRPLWPVEIQKGEVLWPLRFEFDVEFCFPPVQWETSRLQIDALRAIVQAGFQPLKEKTRDATLQAFEPLIAQPVGEEAHLTGLHKQLKARIAEMGRIQKFLAEVEYPMEETRLDVVWRRVEKSVPTYVFEIQVGGDIYHALAKLKHAYDLWNSRIFLVAAAAERSKAESLLSGTFHEIRGRIAFIEIEKMQELYTKKKAYRDLEEDVGIL
jgi:predicted RNA-binding protein